MTIQTTRWGKIEVKNEGAWTFPKGLIGFPECTQMVRLAHPGDKRFEWFQSCDEPGLAFCMADPEGFGVACPVPGEDPLRVNGPVKVRLIVNVVPDGSRGSGILTVNTQGPVLLDESRRLGEQRVLSDKRWSRRQPLIPAAAWPEAQSA